MSVLVFDGDCGFCTRSAQWLARGGRVEIVPWQALDLAQHGLTEQEVTEAAWWLAADGSRAGGAGAIAAALRARGGAAGVLGRILTLPVVAQLAALGYRVVARHRHRLPGGTAACAMPTPGSAPPSEAPREGSAPA